MKKNHLVILLWGILILCSCKQNPKREIIPTTIDETIVIDIQPTTNFEKKRNSSPLAFGIDISHHNNNEIDFIEKRKDSLSFIICKATEGVTYTDPKFYENWKMIKEKGFIRGAYHFYRGDDNPLDQANFFLNTIQSIEITDIPPIIDIEQGSINQSESINSIESNLLMFIQKIEEKLNVTPIIYTNINFANKYLINSIFENYPLWIADYSNTKKPDLPLAWKTKSYSFWQKTDNYSNDDTTNDADIFNGSFTTLKLFIRDSYTKK